MKKRATKLICKRGHTVSVLGRDSSRRCIQCLRDLHPLKVGQPIKSICKNGHDKAVVGRDKHGTCIGCKIAFNSTEEYRNYKKQWYLDNVERLKRGEKEHPKQNKLRINSYVNSRYATDINYKLAKIIRNRLRKALKQNLKPISAIKSLGCSIEDLKQYLVGKFLPNMSWDNWGTGLGKWHIDHIIPLYSFDLTDPQQFAKACHYTNLQPLWSVDNLRKGAKLCL